MTTVPRPLPGVLLALILLGTSAPPLAAPLLDSRAGGLSLVGPASTHPAAVFFNPAALSLLPGHHIYLDGTYRLGVGSITRRSIDPLTGAPAGGSSPARRFLDTGPRYLPQFFLSLSSDLDSESIVAAVAVHTPFVERYSFLQAEEGNRFEPGAQGPTRYHAVDLTLLHLFVTSSVALRVIDELSFGVSVSYIFGMMDYGFVRDAALEGGTRREGDQGEFVALDDCGNGSPCGYEAAAAAEGIRVRGTSNSIGFSAGVLVRPHRRVDLGASYQSRVMDVGRDGLTSRGEAWVRRSLASTLNAAKDPSIAGVARDLSGRATIAYALPDEVRLGAVWRTTDRLELSLRFNWINFSVYDQLAIRLTGTEFRDKPPVPDSIIHYRGFQDVVGVQLGVGYEVSPLLRLELGSMIETSAVPAERVTPAAMDAFKVDSLLALRWSISRRWTLRAGYGLVVMPRVTVAASAFSPAAMVTCVDGYFNVDLAECQRSAVGLGLPSAAGSYTLMVHRLGTSIALDIW